MACAQDFFREFHIKVSGFPAYSHSFDYVENFLGDLAWVRKDGKYFYIKTDGYPADTGRYDYQRVFAEDLKQPTTYRTEYLIRPDGVRID